MNPQELRIGNLLSNWNDAIVTVKDLYYSIYINEYFVGVKETPSRYTFNGKDFKPILLTEEWLLKFGFRKIEAETIFDYEIWGIDDNEFLFEADEKYYHSFIQTEKHEIESVHRLQNLYFALTGEELIIKEND